MNTDTIIVIINFIQDNFIWFYFAGVLIGFIFGCFMYGYNSEFKEAWDETIFSVAYGAAVIAWPIFIFIGIVTTPIICLGMWISDLGNKIKKNK